MVTNSEYSWANTSLVPTPEAERSFLPLTVGGVAQLFVKPINNIDIRHTLS
jgi:hypothetical protein